MQSVSNIARVQKTKEKLVKARNIVADKIAMKTQLGLFVPNILYQYFFILNLGVALLEQVDKEQTDLSVFCYKHGLSSTSVDRLIHQLSEPDAEIIQFIYPFGGQQ